MDTSLPNFKSAAKNPITSIFLILAVLILVITATLAVVNKSESDTKTTGRDASQINPTGDSAISVIGPIQEIDADSKEITVLNTWNQETFSFRIGDVTPIFRDNVQVPFEQLKKDELVGVYFNNEAFNDSELNKDVAYLIILSTEKSTAIPEAPSDEAGYQPATNTEGK